MASGTRDRLGAHQLGPHWLLTTVMLAAALGFPARPLDTLQCYFCPLQDKDDSCSDMTTWCLPHERCSSSRGRFGKLHVLSSQGCVDSDLCGSSEMISYRGVKYNVSHTCCCEDKCNMPPKPDTILKMLLDLITPGYTPPKSDSSLKTLLGMIPPDYANITQLHEEEPWDSCANYTSLRTTTTAAPAEKKH